MPGKKRPRPVTHHLVWDLDDDGMTIMRCGDCERVFSVLGHFPDGARASLSSQDGHARICPGYHRPFPRHPLMGTPVPEARHCHMKG